MTRRVLIAATAATLVAAVLLLGGVLRGEDAAGTRAAGGRAGTQGEIARLQALLRVRAADPARLTELGRAYELRARETADADFLPRARQAYTRALAIDPRRADAVLGLGSLALSAHDFRRALALGRRALRLDPTSDLALAVTGDALLELGRHDAAFAAFERLADRSPGPAAYARIAYGRELVGDRAGAIEAMRLAADSAGTGAEPAAWARVQLGHLWFGEGRPGAAAAEYRQALAALPRYPHALAGLARVEAAHGRLLRARRLAAQAVEAVPLPHFVATLADILAASGRRAEAREQWAVFGALDRLARARGAGNDIELVLPLVDRGVRPTQTLARARAAHARQPSLDGDDLLSWALVRSGRCEEGLRWSKRALRLGTRDALKFFHRGMALRCLGRTAEAGSWFRRALRLNPHFSIRWTPLARRLA